MTHFKATPSGTRTFSEAEAQRAYDYALRSFAYWRPVKVFVRKGKRGRRYAGGGWVR